MDASLFRALGAFASTVAEGSVVGLTRSLVGTDATTALAAGLLIRGAIVGFGVLSGLPGLVIVSNRIAARRRERATLIELQALKVTSAPVTNIQRAA